MESRGRTFISASVPSTTPQPTFSPVTLEEMMGDSPPVMKQARSYDNSADTSATVDEKSHFRSKRGKSRFSRQNGIREIGEESDEDEGAERELSGLSDSAEAYLPQDEDVQSSSPASTSQGNNVQRANSWNHRNEQADRESNEAKTPTKGNGRSLRVRNLDQINPFSTEKENHRIKMRGQVPRNYKKSVLKDNKEAQTSPLTTKKTSMVPRRASKVRRTVEQVAHSFSQDFTQTETPTVETSTVETPTVETPVPDGIVETPKNLSITEKMQRNTTLYISTSIDDAPAVIYLKSCPNIETFFEIVHSLIEDDFDGIRYVTTVTFDWVSDERKRIIRMIEGMEDSYEKMMEELSKAPAWGIGGEGRASIFVNVVMK